MVLMLFVIALVCSAAVVGVYNVTKEPIQKAQEQKVVDALKKVLPEFDNSPAREQRGNCFVYEATLGEEVVGYTIETTSANGFNGNITLMVGILVDGTIYNIEVLAQAETPGLGANMTGEENPLLLSFKGRKPAEMTMTVKKDGGDVDALTAATISSRAYVEAVAFAYGVFAEIAEEIKAAAINPADVLPEHDEVFIADVEGVEVYTATKDGHAVGYAIIGESNKGFNGLVKVMVGYEPDGKIYDVVVLEQNETPGLGSKMCEEDNALLKSIKGKRASRVKFALRSEGGSVDALTHATVSSRAYVEAVATTYETFKKINL
jgi:electron transport complex protein RnfG